MKNPENKVFCVISHTHWDREWYMPMEHFRHRLVDLMDRLLEILAKYPDYIFHLDAQTVVLEDYLAVRPEKKELLRQFIFRRRLMIGPWYLQNDFYLTSGESTVRNLLEGGKLCKEFGCQVKAGYAADQFGNASQLPQIMQGFGIDNFIFGRGFSTYCMTQEQERNPFETPTEFIWQGADGTKVLAIHMKHWYNNAQRFSADIDKATRYLRSIEKKYPDEFTFTPYLLLMNGVDHLEAQPDILEITDAVQKNLNPGEYFLQYNMDDYVDAVKDYITENHVQLSTVTGELRCDITIPILQGTLSSRSYLKTANAEAQILLENRLEPLYAMLEKQGMKGVYPHDRLIYTWKNLLRNHPHDSICGCSHDGVHAHMENRYSEIFEFAYDQLNRGMQTAAEHTAAARKGGDRDYLITVANTLATPLSGTVEVTMKVLCSDQLEQFGIYDGDGKAADFVIVNKKQRTTNVFSPINLPGQLEIMEYTLQLDAGTVEPFAFKTFLVTEATPTEKVRDAAGSSVNEGTDTANAGGRIESISAVQTYEITNGILKVTVSCEGKVDLTDCRTGRTLADCLRLEDMADAGDSYKYLPGGDTPIYSDTWEKTVSVIEKTPLKQTLRIAYTMVLPADYNFDTKLRSSETAVSTLILDLTLRKGRPFAEVDYTLDNASKNHCLRLCLDTDISPVESYADSPFDVVRRVNSTHYPTTPIKVEPNASFAALQESTDDPAGKGFAVFTVGAHEYEHPENQLNRLAMTLVRSTGVIDQGGTENWITPGNQCLRTMTGRLGLCPFTGDLKSADVPNMALSFRAPLLGYASACDSRKFAGGRPCVQDTSLAEFFYLPDTHPQVAMESNRSAITVKGQGTAVTAFKLSEDESGLILRLFNYTEAPAQVVVESPGRIFRTRLDEVPRKFLGNDSITVTLGAKEILTLYLQAYHH